MASLNSIPPFPADIDRDAFGHWLSGFVDGEGSFSISMVMAPKCVEPYPKVSFILRLRADDQKILRLVQSYWRCGCFSFYTKLSSPNSKPQAALQVYSSKDLHNIVVPHFERYPLQAKKARDFDFWKKAVAMLYGVSLRPRRNIAGKKGFRQRWSETERKEFADIMNLLRDQRAYDSATPTSLHGGSGPRTNSVLQP